MSSKPQKNEANGHFLPGNTLWKARSSHGRKPTFTNPEDLRDACEQYFQWCIDNPIMTAKLAREGDTQRNFPVPKVQAFTLAGLCIFIDIARTTWNYWRESRPDLGEVIAWADEVIWNQKFTAAAAGELESNIIARDLGLSEKLDHRSPDGSMTPAAAIDFSGVPTEALQAVLAAIRGGATDDQ